MMMVLLVMKLPQDKEVVDLINIPNWFSCMDLTVRESNCARVRALLVIIYNSLITDLRC